MELSGQWSSMGWIQESLLKVLRGHAVSPGPNTLPCHALRTICQINGPGAPILHPMIRRLLPRKLVTSGSRS